MGRQRNRHQRRTETGYAVDQRAEEGDSGNQPQQPDAFRPLRAGAFGYEADHYDVSMKMAEAALLPALRKAGADTLLVADGTSCRHQIRDGLNSGKRPGAGERGAVHVAQVLAQALGARP